MTGGAALLPRRSSNERVRHHVPAFEWPALAGDVAAIRALKRERNAVVLAHNYQAPEIFHTVADIVGTAWHWPARPPGRTPT